MRIKTHPKLSQHGFELVTLPLIAFLIESMQNNSEIITSTLNPLSGFLKQKIKREPNKEKYIVKPKIVKEIKNSSFKEYSFEGSPDKYDDFITFVKEDCKDD